MRTTRLLRPISAAALIVFLVVFVFPRHPLTGQPYKSYQSQGRQRVTDVIGRASRFTEERDWSNYVQLGIATEQARWEEDALDDLAERMRRIEQDVDDAGDQTREKERARALYHAALQAWEDEAEDHFFEERGLFRARTELKDDIRRITEEQYQAAIARAQAQTAGLAELDLNLWDSTIAAELQDDFERRSDDLQDRLADARGAVGVLGPAERTAFEQELARLEGELQREFALEDSYYLKRARNRFVLVYTSSHDNARLEAEGQSAAAIGERIIESTFGDLQTQTDDLLARAVADMQDLVRQAGPNIENVDGAEWERRVQAIIDAGLRKWDLAEEDLYGKRLEWMRTAQRSREEADRVWRSNHESLKREMERWLETVQEQVRDGRRQWAQKHAELAASREQAEVELSRYIDERTRSRGEFALQLRELVQGGGAALLEAKEARSYYEQVMQERGWSAACNISDAADRSLCQFYQQENDRLAASIVAFESILLGTPDRPGSEDILRDLLHGSGTDTGLLNDRRAYAGDLPQRIAALDEDGFEESLRELMQAESEDFVLYRRDLLSLADANHFFVTRTTELLDSSGWTLSAATDLEDLRRRISALAGRFGEQKSELFAILNKPRDESLDAPARLRLILEDIERWQERSQNRDARLKGQVARYFRLGTVRTEESVNPEDGNSGLHPIENQNDPYLMTRAELEWELLRRERNALAARFERAQAVKRYADLAKTHDAALELADLTRERAETAEAHAALLELSYLLAKGDIDLNQNVYSEDPALREAALSAELDRLLVGRGLDPASMQRKQLRLSEESRILSEIEQLGSSAVEPGDLTDLRQQIQTFMQTHVVADDDAATEDLRARHRFGALERKLAALADQWSGLSDTVRADRVSALSGAAAMLAGETWALEQSYDFDGYEQSLIALRERLVRRPPKLLQGDLAAQREQIEQNARDLTLAARTLEEARGAYREAYLDLHIITSGSGADLIEKELAEASGALAGVLNRMVRIEAVPGFEETIGDRLTAARAEYLSELSAGERSAYEALRAEELLVYIQGLEEARTREQRLDEIIIDEDAASLSPEDLARVLVEHAEEISSRAGSDARLHSDGDGLAALDRLRSALASLGSLRTALSELESADPVPEDLPGRRADLEARIEIELAGLGSAGRQVILAVRGEVRARDHVLSALLRRTNPDDSPVLDPTEFAGQTEEEAKQLDERAYEVAASAARTLLEFLEQSSGRTYPQLVTDVRGRLAALGAANGGATVDLSGDGFGSDEMAPVSDAALWRMVLRWVVANRAQLEYVAQPGTENDPRSPAIKWAAMLQRVAELESDSDFHRQFEESIPSDPQDQWVTDFITERTRLLDEVRRIAGLPALEQSAAYAALSDADRRTLEGYGRPDPSQWNASLLAMESQLLADLAAAPYRYRALYLREAARKASESLAQTDAEWQTRSADVGSLEQRIWRISFETEKLEQDLALALPGPERDQLQRRLDDARTQLQSLENALADLRPRLTELADQRRQWVNQIQEAGNPGSTSALYGLALGEIMSEATEVYRKRRVLASMAEARRTSQALASAPDPRESGPTDQIFAALGWVQLDVRGHVLRSGDSPVLSAEGEALAATLPDGQLSLPAVFARQNTGAELALWVNRLQQWQASHPNSAEIPAEVRAVIELLEQSFRDYQAARLYIEVTRQGLSAERLLDDGRLRREAAAKQLEDLARLGELEAALQASVERGMRGEVPILLAGRFVLEAPENLAFLRRLTASLPDAPTGSPGALLFDKASELLLLAERLRESHTADAISGLSLQFAQIQALVGVSGYRGKQRALEQFYAAHPELSADDLRARIGALAQVDLRATLTQILAEPDVSQSLFATALAQVLAQGPDDGDELRQAALDAIDALAARLTDALAEAADASHDSLALNLYVGNGDDNSIEALLADYAGVATHAQQTYQPALEAIQGDTLDGAELRSAIRESIEEQLGNPAHALVRGEALGILEQSYESLTRALSAADEASDQTLRDSLRQSALGAFRSEVFSALFAFVAALEDPEEAEVADLRSAIFAGELEEAGGLISVADEFPGDSIPEELHDLLLLRELERAEDRYAEFLADRNDPARAPEALLVLDGLGGDFARMLAAREWDLFAADTDVASFLADAPPTAAGALSSRTAEQYLSAFVAQQKLAPLPPGVARSLTERILQKELVRLENDANVMGGIHLLDPFAYLGDFSAMILAARVRHHAQSNSVVIVGSDQTEREASYETAFEDLLASAAYGPAPLGSVFVTESDRESLFRLAFSFLEAGLGDDAFLPSVLRDMQSEGRDVRSPLLTGEELLPQELREINNYRSANYRDLAATLPARALLGILYAELGEHIAQSEDLSVLLSDEALDALLERALPNFAIENDLRLQLAEFVRAHNERTALGAPATLAEAVERMRSAKVLANVFGEEPALRAANVFQAAHGPLLDEIEVYFFDALESLSESGSASAYELRERAKEQRGDFLAALVRHYQISEGSPAQETDYFLTVLSDSERQAMDSLARRLLGPEADGGLRADARRLLLAQAQQVAGIFQFRSGQELVRSGLFSALEALIFGRLQRSAAPELLAAAQEKRPDVLRDLLGLVGHLDAGGAEDNYSFASAIDGLGPQLVALVREMDPQLRRTLRDERVLIDRFLGAFLETNAERARLEVLLSDPAASIPNADLSGDYTLVKERALLQSQQQDLTRALLVTVGEHARHIARGGRELERERALGIALERFALERGTDDLNFTESRFASARTYYGSELPAQARQYRNYVDGLLQQALQDANDLETVRVAELRTYLQWLQSQEPDQWRSTTDIPADVQSFSDFSGLSRLASNSLDLDARSILLDGSYEELLRSDDLGATAGTHHYDNDNNDPSDDLNATVRPVQTVSSLESLVGSDDQATARNLYFANLANNYLEAVSGLQEALAQLARAGALAEARLAPVRDGTRQESDLLARFRQAMGADNGDLAGARLLLEQARSEKAAHGAGQLESRSAAINQATLARSESARKLAQAGRRKFLFGRTAANFIERAFERIAGDLDRARTEHTRLSDQAQALREEYSRLNSEYVAGLNQTSLALRKTMQARREADRQRSIAEYARTPYLFASLGLDGDVGSSGDPDLPDSDTPPEGPDAQEEYDRARLSLLRLEDKLEQAAYNVLVQDRVHDFTRIARVFFGEDEDARAELSAPLSPEDRKQLRDLRERLLKNGDELSAGEHARLQQLSDRDLFDRHRDLIVAREDYFRHALRMIRLRKAQELVSAEIQRREALVNERKRDFEDQLNQTFTLPPGASEEQKAARLAVYRRLARIAGEGGDLYREYRGWYYGTGQWLTDMGRQAGSQFLSGNFQQTTLWPTVIAEGLLGQQDAAGINPDDRNAIAIYQQASGGRGWAGYNDFHGAYKTQLTNAAAFDASTATLALTTATMSVLMTAGYALMASGASLVAYGSYQITMGTMTLPYGASLIASGTATVAAGTVLIGAGSASVATATAAIASATTQQLWAGVGLFVANKNTMEASSSDVRHSQLQQLQEKERLYEEALASLNYFKKAPDQQTVKERIIEWGRQHSDSDPSGAPLYAITEEDLDYLFEHQADGTVRLVHADGSTAQPDDEVRRDGLDIGVLRRDGTSRDTAGNRYDADPSTYLDSPPGELRAGYYYQGDHKYTQIRVLQHDGGFATKYARVIAEEPDTPVDTDSFFDLGEILVAAVNHGQGLLTQKRQAYFAAGDAGPRVPDGVDPGSMDPAEDDGAPRYAADSGFLLREREAMMGAILQIAGGRQDGGVEFSGYRAAFDEYLAIAGAIDAAELEQRVALQVADWDLRAAELREKEAEWERRFETIIERGRKSWAGVLNRFRQEWRQWEKDFDKQVADGDQHYQDKVREHFAARQKWENDTRAAFEERTISEQLGTLIEQLNNQIAAINANAGLDLAQLDKLAEIQQQLNEIRKDRPGAAQQLRQLNDSIAKFNTNLGVSEFTHIDHGKGLSAITKSYADELKGHRQNMTRVAKAKAMEQFQSLLGKLKERIKKENYAIERQTANAAAEAGFIRQGERYIKTGGTLDSFGFVDAYRHFEGDAEIERMMQEAGFAMKSGKDLTDFLQDDEKTDVEVQAYFDLQRYALQTVFDRIMGTGSASQRKSSGDEQVIGRFGKWAGRAPDSRNAGYLNQLTGGSYSSLGGDNVALLTQNAIGSVGGNNVAGSGELGAFGLRPSGVAFGFYVQLQHMGQHVSESSQRDLNLDPFSAGMASVLPVSGIANSYLDMQISTRVHGVSAGKARAKFNNQAGRAALKAGGMIAAGLGTGGVATAGYMGIMAGNTLQDNGKFQLTSRGAVGMGTGLLAASGLGAGANVLAGGFQYAGRGRVDGAWSLRGARGDAVGANILGGAFGGAAVGSVLGDGFGQSLLGAGIGNSLAAYGQRQTGNEGAWQAFLGQDIETSIAGIGGVVQNGVSNHVSGGGGGFGERLLGGLTKPFTDLATIGQQAVSGLMTLLSAAVDLVSSVVTAPFAGLMKGADWVSDGAVTNWMHEQATTMGREGPARSSAPMEAALVAAGAGAALRRREDGYGVSFDGLPWNVDTDQTMNAGQLTTVIRGIMESQPGAGQMSAADYNRLVGEVQEAIGSSGTVEQALEFAKQKGLSVNAQTIAQAGARYEMYSQQYDAAYVQRQAEAAAQRRAALEQAQSGGRKGGVVGKVVNGWLDVAQWGFQKEQEILGDFGDFLLDNVPGLPAAQRGLDRVAAIIRKNAYEAAARDARYSDNPANRASASFLRHGGDALAGMIEGLAHPTQSLSDVWSGMANATAVGQDIYNGSISYHDVAAVAGAVYGTASTKLGKAWRTVKSAWHGDVMARGRVAAGTGVVAAAVVGMVLDPTGRPRSGRAFARLWRSNGTKVRVEMLRAMEAGGLDRSARRVAFNRALPSGKIRIVNGRRPINSRFAGTKYPLSADLAEKYPLGVRFTNEGFPDFAPHALARLENVPNLTGKYAVDERLANRLLGIKGTPTDLVWHHVEDGTTLLLIPKDLHRAVRHSGGAAMIRSLQ